VSHIGCHRGRGPTIRFFQSCKGAPIKFKTEWIEKFIDRCTVDSLPTNPPEYVANETFGLDAELFDV